MATIVLTAVGTALGGPIGGAIGALAGSAIDREVLFKPKGREGPRLAELKVQTSSYGTPIPPIWGTLRVAGTVIWATDLLETRTSSRGGKGQPSVAGYSYAASFAVLLSARPIARVGRIWADGELIRGAAGDWKVQTGFRLYGGGEDQAADPLIQSAEGGLAPAHRGCAYAVFEQLQLATFGNRIPSLSFEVVAEERPVAVGAIARDVAGVTGAAGAALDGFAASGTARDVLELLGEVGGAWWSPDGDGLVLRDAPGPVTVIADQGGAHAGRRIAAADAAPGEVSVRHYDPARDWQAGLQRARGPGPRSGRGGALSLDLPAAMSAAAAKGIAMAVLARREAARVRRTVAGRWDALALVPGDTVALADEAGLWRVEQLSLATEGVTLELSPLVPAPRPVAASAGRVLPAPDRVTGRTLLHAAELPALDDVVLTQPRLSVVATGEGEGWRAAALLLSTDGGASWTNAGATALPGVLGTVVAAPGPAGAALVDRAHTLVVELARDDMALGDADAAALDAGANLALVGGELIQFGRAEPLGGARWRLLELWRGRRGMAGPVAAGDRFALLERDAVRVIDLPIATLGGSVRLMATGVGDADPVMLEVPVSGASVLPPAPVALRLEVAGGDATVRWTRRSRIGWRWLDGVDAPLGEEREAYRVTVTDSGGHGREVEVPSPAVALSVTERAGCTVAVRQRGTWGESGPAILEVR